MILVIKCISIPCKLIMNEMCHIYKGMLARPNNNQLTYYISVCYLLRIQQYPTYNTFYGQISCSIGKKI